MCLAHSAGEVQQQTVQQEYMELSSELNKVCNSSCRAAEGTKTGTRTGALERSVMGDGVENTAKLARGTRSKIRCQAHDANFA